MVPLGVHVGAPSSTPGYTVLLCLEAFCFDAEHELWYDMAFPDTRDDLVRVSKRGMKEHIILGHRVSENNAIQYESGKCGNSGASQTRAEQSAVYITGLRRILRFSEPKS